MSTNDVALVRRLYELFAEGRSAEALDYYADDVVWDTTGMDWANGQVYHGVEGVRRFWRSWLSGWSEYHAPCGELVDAGNGVVAHVQVRARSHSSGTMVALDHYQVWSLRDGQVYRVRFFLDRDEALRAGAAAVPAARPSS